MSTLRKAFAKNWYAVEAIPIYVVIGGTVAGASWYLYRLAMGPTITWTKANPTPWNTIKPHQSTKLVQISDTASEKWSRDKL